MTQMNEAVEGRPARIMLGGFPGAGKTGALACLANAGFKLRILDYDGNLDPLYEYVHPDKLANIDYVTLEDPLRAGADHSEVAGRPEAFTKGWKMLDHWHSIDTDGVDRDLGRSKDWGPDTIVIIDSLTGMGRAAMRRTLCMNHRTIKNRRQNDWGIAASEQEALLEKLTSAHNQFHIIVTAHLKMIGPKIEASGDSDTAKIAKDQAADLVQTRLYPSAIGWAMPQTIAEHFPVFLLVESTRKPGRAIERMIHTNPRAELDIKVPFAAAKKTYPLEDGLLTIIDHISGGVENCLKKGAEMAKAVQEKETENG